MTEKVFLEGAELALHEAKERKRLRIEAENKAKEMEEAAMEDMMMGIEDYESEDEEEAADAAKEGLWCEERFGSHSERCADGLTHSRMRLSTVSPLSSPAPRDVQSRSRAVRCCAVPDVLCDGAQDRVGRVRRSD